MKRHFLMRLVWFWLCALGCGSFALLAQSGKPLASVDGNLAFAHVQKLVSFGPRPPGSAAMRKTQAYLIEQLKKCGLAVEEQDFLAATPIGSTGMKNIVARIPGKQGQAVVVGSHYDTKYMPNAFFVGANDGGSSTGLLLEIARVLSLRKLNCPVCLVFFDGEEAFQQWSPSDSLYGSRAVVENMKRKGTLSQVRAMFLLDMIGDRELVLEKDYSSTSWLVDLVWQSARELGYQKHLSSFPKAMDDDHVPFLRAGIPSVDLIDFEYGFNNLYWHTSNDTLDKVSPRSLKVTGDILLRSLEKLCSRP
jgi:Zn-dependent M28 family amino/carboxypeptidase